MKITTRSGDRIVIDAFEGRVVMTVYGHSKEIPMVNLTRENARELAAELIRMANDLEATRQRAFLGIHGRRAL